MDLRRLSGRILAGLLGSLPVLVASSSGCGGSSHPTVPVDAGKDSPGLSADAAKPVDQDFAGCSTCALPDGGTECMTSGSVNACCVCVLEPTTTLARAVGLHDYSTTSPSAVDFSCLAAPPKAGPVHTTTLTGYVKIFSSGTDTAGVKVQVFNVDTSTGVLGAQVGSTFMTSMTDPSETNTWLNACTSMPCTFRQYTITGVPTETPLVIQTSDAGSHIWSTLYDYDVYFSDAATCTTTPPGAPCVNAAGTATNYDVTAVAPGDITLAASVAGGFTVASTEGVIAGEVHDCGDIRLSGANVGVDQTHTGPIIYFGTDADPDESDPTPNQSQTSTSPLGLYAGLDFEVGVPIKVSAIGNYAGKDTLLGTAVVQAYAGPSVTAITLRGLRPFQTDHP